MEILYPSTWQVITITGWLVVLGFNTTSTVKIIPCRSVTHFSFQSHRLHFSHASAEVRGKNTPERKFTQTGDQTHNHQVMSPTRLTNEPPGWGGDNNKRAQNDTKGTLAQVRLTLSQTKG